MIGIRMISVRIIRRGMAMLERTNASKHEMFKTMSKYGLMGNLM